MKIKIIENIPVEEQYKPTVGETYEVVKVKNKPDSKRPHLYFIMVNGQEVGVYPHSECEVVERD